MLTDNLQDAMGDSLRPGVRCEKQHRNGSLHTVLTPIRSIRREPRALYKPLAYAPGGDWHCGVRLILEPAKPLHSVGQNRRRNWKNGATAHVLNVLERQRTVGISLNDGVLIGSLTRMAVEMAVDQGLVEPFSGSN